jgi:hypothetical protein
MRAIMIKLKRALCIVLLLLLLPSISCKDKGTEPTEEGGIGIIVPGKGIEGINLGDSKDDVKQKLGTPSEAGLADGIYRSWLVYDYFEGPHAGLSVYFIEEDNTSYGPIDELVAVAPYSGKTREGIGLGTTLNDVHKIYGKPKNELLQPAEHWVEDFYCFNGKKLEIHYVDSVITTMSIGYYIPMPKDTLSSCR